MLVLASTEFEANAKSILTINGYSEAGNWNISDYYKLNSVMRLSEYIITIPIWDGNYRTIQPFAQWKSSHSLAWYQDYNKVKHNRASAFSSASFGNAVTAVAAVFTIVFAQFYILAFDPHHTVEFYSSSDNILSHNSCLLYVELPTSWTLAEQYDFDWQTLLVTDPLPFQKYPF